MRTKSSPSTQRVYLVYGVLVQYSRRDDHRKSSCAISCALQATVGVFSHKKGRFLIIDLPPLPKERYPVKLFAIHFSLLRPQWKTKLSFGALPSGTGEYHSAEPHEIKWVAKFVIIWCLSLRKGEN